MNLTLEQRRAQFALSKINQRKTDDNYGNYRNYVKALPATILMNGLGQSAATLLAQAKGKATEAHHMLYDDLSMWLCGSDPDVPYRSKGDLMKAIVDDHGPSSENLYLLAQAEAIAYVGWLKKFAVAFLKEGQGE